MTSLKDKLQALNNEALQLENDVKSVNGDHRPMMDKLDEIETFIKDSKQAIEDSAADTETNAAYEDLKDTLTRLKTEITTLKTQNLALKNKINSIAGICVFSGTLVGVLGTLGFNALKGLVDKYTVRP